MATHLLLSILIPLKDLVLPVLAIVNCQCVNGYLELCYAWLRMAIEAGSDSHSDIYIFFTHPRHVW
jgi:hypothetical protein